MAVGDEELPIFGLRRQVMARRNSKLLNGVRFCGDSEKMEFHDLDRETPNCGIDNIIASGKIASFDTLFRAINSGYHFCRWCIGGDYKFRETKEESIVDS